MTTRTAMESSDDNETSGASGERQCSSSSSTALKTAAQHVGGAAGSDNKTDAAKQKPRRQQFCGYCRNHKLKVPKANHHCQYEECTCLFCNLTRRRRKVMCHQQRLWRFQKINAGQKEDCEDDNTVEQELTPNNTFPHEEPRRRMVCDKCRNHDVIVNKRGHKGSCPFESCTCDLCSFTIKRQQLMKHQQRVRRSQISGPTEQSDKCQSLALSNADSPDSEPHPLEGPALTTTTTKERQRKDEDSLATKNPPVAPSTLDKPPTVEWSSAVKVYAKQDLPQTHNNHFHPETTAITTSTTTTTTTTCQLPCPEPLPHYQGSSEINSSHPINQNEHNFNSARGIEYPDNVRLSLGCGGCVGQFPQVQATSTTLPALSTYGRDVGHQSFMPWTAGVYEPPGGRCSMEANNNNRPHVPLRPQPIPAVRLPRPQMEWPFIRLSYPPSSIVQCVPQRTISVCDNYRSPIPQCGRDEHWITPQRESNMIPCAYSNGIPYIASALFQSSAKPSLPLMSSASAPLPHYNSPLSRYMQRDHYHANTLDSFTTSCNNNVI